MDGQINADSSLPIIIKHVIGMILLTFNTHKTDHFKHFEPFKVETEIPQEAVGHTAHIVSKETIKMFLAMKHSEKKRKKTLSKSADEWMTSEVNCLFGPFSLEQCH